jgi:hypothetical protein
MNRSEVPDLNHSHLFLVRVWSERDGEGKAEWTGKLQHMVTGEARPFRGCPELIEVLVAMLSTEAQKSHYLADV